MIFKIKYNKYKEKYLLLKNKLLIDQSIANTNQIGGNFITDTNQIIKFYENIMESGIYNNDLSKFEKFCKFVIEQTINEEEIIQLKKKIYLESKKLTDTQEYRDLLNKIKNRGKEYKKIGEEFEKLVFTKLFDLIKNDIGIKTKSKIKILKNPILYLSTAYNDDKWELLGEVDAIVIKEEDGIKYIMGICEFKHSFDDIPDALFQIKRTYDAINSNKLVKLDNKILDKTYKFINHKSYLDIAFIFTSSINSNNNYFNISSKLKHYLINMLHTFSKKKYKKLLDKIKKKQIHNDKLNNNKILRYNTDVLEIIQLLKTNNLLNRLKIIK